MQTTGFRIRAGLVILFGASAFANGATLCVIPSGQNGCSVTINAAIAKAKPNDTIKVGEGTYREGVIISIPLSLLGTGADRTIIDAIGLANGINIDGHNHPGLTHVNVRGFTVKNSNFEGILVTDSSYVTVTNNHVTGNDKRLQPFASGGPVCPGLPAYFVNFQGFDCGEGIHLSGVAHSTVAGNLVDRNSGGILLSDDTGATRNNLITGNTVADNPYDCGITLASHHLTFTPDPAWAVFHNTVANNTSVRNGLQTGEGAGVGIFAAPPGAQNYANVVMNNTLTGNALPGVALHSHSPLQNLNNNLITGNQISGNGPDGDPGTTVPTGIVVFGDDAAGAPPITGTLMIGNIIRDEGIDIAVKTAGAVDAHFNQLLGQTGLANLGAGSVNATLNWWNCPDGPGANGCSTVSGSGVLVSPWLIGLGND